MRLLTFDELSESADADRLLVHVTTLGGATNRRSVDLWRRRSNYYAPYAGIFAVEGATVLGQVLVKRLPYTFRDRTETVTAVASVGTRADRARRGIASKLLEEVHRRERADGIRFATLWTNRSWGAVRVYERLGYEGIYSIPFALRPAPRARVRPPSLRGVRRAGRSDLAELEELRERLAEGRIGFCHRPERFLETSTATWEIDPPHEILVVRDRGRAEGYVVVRSNPYRLICGELVATTPRVAERLVAAVERAADDRPTVLEGSAVADRKALLGRRGYRLLEKSYGVFMARPLDGRWDARTAIRAFATDDPRFLCQVGDRF